MKKKSLILLMIILFILSISVTCFATNAGNDVKNAIGGTTNTVVDGAQNLAEDVRNGIGAAEDTVENGVRDIGNTMMDDYDRNDNTDDGAYTATRTSADDLTTQDITNVSIWTWIAVAIAGIVIVGLVWYYSTQNKDNH